jgi:nucleoside-diphosphate-sugar epimerase
VILYNGASGGIGRFLEGPISHLAQPSHALAARLEDQAGLAAELGGLDPGREVTLIHLAARVSVPACEADPPAAFNTNVVLARATVETVIDWAAQRGVMARVIYVSTGHVYAAQPDGSKVSEDGPTHPRSVYARTKLAAEETLLSLASSHGVPLLVARVFGLLAPSQAPNYVLPALIERAKSDRLSGIPGLDFVRDYLDARDVCENLLLFAAAPWRSGPQVVNVCSGTPVTIRQLLDAVLHEVDPERADEAAQRATPSPGRPDDIRWLVGDPSRFVQLTGNQPQRIPLSRTVKDAVHEMGHRHGTH